jgi:hypothetical protein
MMASDTDLEKLPGVGPNIAEHLRSIGIDRIADLKGNHPEEMYERVCQRQGRRIDRCLLYVFRCAVYAASTPHPDAELLKWWNWKDHETKRQKHR